MPIYEYRCKVCEHGYERLVKSSRALAPACPACGSKRVERLLSSFSALSGGAAKGNCSLGACPSGSCMGGGCMREQG